MSTIEIPLEVGTTTVDDGGDIASRQGIKALTRKHPKKFQDFFDAIGGRVLVYYHDYGIHFSKEVPYTTVLLLRHNLANINRAYATQPQVREDWAGILSESEKDMYSSIHDYIEFDAVMYDTKGRFMVGVNKSHRLVATCDYAHNHTEELIDAVHAFILRHLPKRALIIPINEIGKVVEVKVEKETYPPHIIADVERRVRSFIEGHTQQLKELDSQYKKQLEQIQKKMINDKLLQLGRMGFEYKEGWLIAKPRKKLYNFSYYDEGKFKLKSDTHIAYIAEIKINLEDKKMNVYMTGYHPNQGPWETGMYTPVLVKEKDNIVQACVHSEYMCLGSMEGKPITPENIIAFIEMISMPDIHNKGWDMPLEQREPIEGAVTWKADEWSTTDF
jgi:hypothetical protein